MLRARPPAFPVDQKDSDEAVKSGVAGAGSGYLSADGAKRRMMRIRNFLFEQQPENCTVSCSSELYVAWVRIEFINIGNESSIRDFEGVNEPYICEIVIFDIL